MRVKAMALHMSQERMSYLINAAGPNGCPYEEKCNGTSVSYHTQNSFPKKKIKESMAMLP